MNEEAGNQYQAGEVDFDIQVLATQYSEEEDSFGPDYDANADASPDNTYFFDKETASAAVTAGQPTTVTTNSATVTVPATAETENGDPIGKGDTLKLTVEPTDTNSTLTVAATNNTTSYEVSLTNQNGEKVTCNDGIKVELYIGQVDLQSFYHNTTELEEVFSLDDLDVDKYYYDPAAGIITFITKTFSPFTAEYKYSGGLGEEDCPYIIASDKDFETFLDEYEYVSNAYCYVMKADINVKNKGTYVQYVRKANSTDSYAGVFMGIFDGGGHTINFTWDDVDAMETDAVSLFGELMNATIKNLTVNCNIDTKLDVGVLSSYSYYGTTIENVTVSGTIRSEAQDGNLGGLTLATWELKSDYPALFKNVTVSADIYWKPAAKQGYYLYIAPFIAQTVGLSYVTFENCTSSGSLHIPFVEGVTDSVTDLYTGAFYGCNPNYPDVPTANCTGNVNTCVKEIPDVYALHIADGLPENAWD